MTRTLAATVLCAAALLATACGSAEPEAADTVATASGATTATTTAAAATTDLPTGNAFYIQACADMTEAFASFQEIAGMTGEPWDPDKAADEMMELIKTDPEVMKAQTDELNESIANLESELGTAPIETTTEAPSNEPTWDELTKDQQFQLERAVRAAAAGDC